jgi:electron transfer flavoprotein alpha subunit
MSILIFTESENNKLKRNTAEVASYGTALAEKLNKDCVAVSFNADQAQELGKYGITKVLNVTNAPQQFDAHTYASVLTHYIKSLGATHIILSSSADAKFIAPLLAANTNAAYVPNVVALPLEKQPLTVKRTVFTNKAFANTTLTAEVNIIGVGNNAFGAVEQAVNCVVENTAVEHTVANLEQLSITKESGKATIADAEVVVSGGRGLKGPENWHLVENLAEVLGAATACSKPVSDMGWRSHDEHVGQTGKPVSTNLYIAIGISGAIQHLAGVNASKVKVVINNDPEAPFFKAADYGIVGDAFEVVPVLTEKLKAFKSQS